MNINYLPRGERLLSGTISALLTDSATTIEVSNPPSASELPTYIEFEPDSSANRELVRVIKVSSNIITIERGLNNGGTGIEHASNSSYKQKITSRHWDAVADAIQEGYLMEDSIRTLTRASDTQFTVDGYGAGDDLTSYYTQGRILRCNSSDSDIVIVTSSSYSAGTNKTTVDISGTLPATMSTIELGVFPKGATNKYLNGSSPDITTPKITTSINDANGNEVIETPATTNAVNHVKATNAATGGTPKLSAAGDDTNIDIELEGKGTGKVKIDARYGAITSDTDGATITFDMSASNLHTVTLADNRTLAVSNVSVGQVFILRLVQDGTGSRTVTWFSTIKWVGGAAPELSTDANAVDTFGFLCTSSGNYDGYIVGQALA